MNLDQASRVRWEIESAEGWRDFFQKMPFIAFPAGWEICIVPPFAGALARFRVKLPSGGIKSVYFDAYGRLGAVDEPYWEVYPYQGDVGRCLLLEVGKLLEMIADESEGEQS